MFDAQVVEFVTFVKDLLVTLSTLVVIGATIYGLRKWRSEYTWKIKFEIARRMVLLAFRFRDEFQQARNSFTFPGESTDRPKGDDETPNESNLLDEYYARKVRLSPLSKTLQELKQACWEIEAVSGEHFWELVQPLNDTTKDLFVSIETYFFMKHKPMRRPISGVDETRLQELYKQINCLSDDDEISNLVEITVDKLIQSLKKYIR